MAAAFSATSITNVRKKGRGEVPERVGDKIDILTGMPKPKREPRADENENDKDIITGLPKSASQRSLGKGGLSREGSAESLTDKAKGEGDKEKDATKVQDGDGAASGKEKEKGKEKEGKGEALDPITGRPVPQRKGSVTKGSFAKSQVVEVKDEEDIITGRKMQVFSKRLPQANPKEDVGGIFKFMEDFDDVAKKCPKCGGPIYIDRVNALKGAYITDRAVYNVEKSVHRDCGYFHPKRTNIDPEKQRSDFAIFTCCNQPMTASGCRLKGWNPEGADA
jgi:hypothetical protein